MYYFSTFKGHNEFSYINLLSTTHTNKFQLLLIVINMVMHRMIADGTGQALDPVCTVEWPTTGLQPDISYKDHYC